MLDTDFPVMATGLALCLTALGVTYSGSIYTHVWLRMRGRGQRGRGAETGAQAGPDSPRAEAGPAEGKAGPSTSPCSPLEQGAAGAEEGAPSSPRPAPAGGGGEGQALPEGQAACGACAPQPGPSTPSPPAAPSSPAAPAAGSRAPGEEEPPSPAGEGASPAKGLFKGLRLRKGPAESPAGSRGVSPRALRSPMSPTAPPLVRVLSLSLRSPQKVAPEPFCGDSATEAELACVREDSLPEREGAKQGEGPPPGLGSSSEGAGGAGQGAALAIHATSASLGASSASPSPSPEGPEGSEQPGSSRGEGERRLPAWPGLEDDDLASSAGLASSAATPRSSSFSPPSAPRGRRGSGWNPFADSKPRPSPAPSAEDKQGPQPPPKGKGRHRRRASGGAEEGGFFKRRGKGGEREGGPKPEAARRDSGAAAGEAELGPESKSTPTSRSYASLKGMFGGKKRSPGGGGSGRADRAEAAHPEHLQPVPQEEEGTLHGQHSPQEGPAALPSGRSGPVSFVAEDPQDPGSQHHRRLPKSPFEALALPHSPDRSLSRLRTVSAPEGSDAQFAVGSAMGSLALQNSQSPTRRRQLAQHGAPQGAPPAVPGLPEGLPNEWTPLERQPTEEGFSLKGHVDAALAELAQQGEAGLPRKAVSGRTSRSFSEPNLLSSALLEQSLRHMGTDSESRSSSPEKSESSSLYGGPSLGSSQRPSPIPQRRGGGGRGQVIEAGARSPLRKPPGAPGGDAEPPAPLLLEVTGGPVAGTSFTLDESSPKVTLGRLASNTCALEDGEVSGAHAVLHWEAAKRTWQVTDLGSLNGTSLNGRIISTSNRTRGRQRRLNSGDELVLGSHTALRVHYLPLPTAHAARLGALPKRVLAPSTALSTLPTVSSDRLRAAVLATPHAPPSPAATPRLSSTSVAVAGLALEACTATQTGREHLRKGQGNEDVAVYDVTPPGAPLEAALFCLCDGHCGRAAALEVAQQLPQLVAGALRGATPSLLAGKGLPQGLWEGMFAAADAGIAAEEGCTATCILVWKDGEGRQCLQVANVGDSAACYATYWGRRANHLEPYSLTEDHRLTNPAERSRLAGMGIKLSPGHNRLYGLNLSRVMGDRYLKEGDLGLSAQPFVSEALQVPGMASAVVVLASDGLWDVATHRQALQVAVGASMEAGGSAQAMAEALVAFAQRQRTKDDCTVTALRLLPLAGEASDTSTHTHEHPSSASSGLSSVWTLNSSLAHGSQSGGPSLQLGSLRPSSLRGSGVWPEIDPELGTSL